MPEIESNRDSPFNEEFCTQLEYHLGQTFANSNRPDLKGFWCDGVSWFPAMDTQLTQKCVNDTRKIVTKAWIGKTGQDEYHMTIHFGKSSSTFAKGTELIDCIPSEETLD
ncbi:MAG: hypothetical protein IPI91_20410 [Flavobacteriales bacterium]|nr:hypothetical protein [Flavobacteriales bacterium]